MILNSLINSVKSNFIIFLGLASGVLFWFIESLVDVFILNKGNFTEQILTTNSHELRMRLLVVCFLFILGVIYQAFVNKLRRSKEEIRRQNEILNNTLESLSHPFYVIDANDYTIKLANSASRNYGISEGDACYALTHKRKKPCEGPDETCPLKLVKKTKKPVTVEHVHYNNQGEKSVVEIHGYPIFDNEGNVVQMIECCLDITKRKQAEGALQKQSHELKKRVKELNCLYEISRLAIESDTSLDKILHETVNLISQSWQYPEITCARIIIGDQKYTTSNFNKTKWKLSSEIVVSGKRLGQVEVYYLEKRPTIDEGPFLKEEKYLIDAIARQLGNISNRIQQSEQALERSEKLYRETVDHLPLHLGVTDQDGNHLIWNKHSEKMFGYSPGEVIGKMKCDDIINKNGNASILYKNALKHGIVETKIDLIGKDGKVFPAEVIIVPIFQSNNKHTGYLELVQDITQIEENKNKVKKLSGELLKSEENQRKKLRAELHDEAGVAITAIKFSSNMIRKLISLDRYDEIESYIDSIIESSNNLSLELRKLFYNLAPANIDQTGLLYALNDYLTKINTNTGLKIDTDISGDIESNNIVINTVLYRIVQEAVTNIIRHSKANKVSLTLAKKDNNTYLRITDNGKGLDPKKRKKGAYGLKGIHDRIVDLGGSFNLDSTSGKGTSLEIQLPTL